LKTKYEDTKVQMEEMKRQKTENSKRLIEMSGLVKSLQVIPVNYEKTKAIDGNNFVNVQRKIEAIMHEMNEAKKRYDELRNEKYFQNDTIQAQEQHIESMEEQIDILKKRLEREEIEQKEQQKKAAEKQSVNTEELEQQVMLQEMEIMNLTAEIHQLKKGSTKQTAIGAEIKAHEASNAAKYAAIQKMEEQLASLQDEQIAQKMRKVNIVKKHTEEQSGKSILEPTPTTVAEISKLEDDLTNLRLEQEKISAAEKLKKIQILPPPQKPPSSRLTGSKSQPWDRDLEWKDSICKNKIELDVVTQNNDATVDERDPVAPEPESDKEGQNENMLTLPTLTNEKKVVKSARKKKRGGSAFGATDRSVSSNASQSLESIAEEKEIKQTEIQNVKTLNGSKKNIKSNFSDTSRTEEMSRSSHSSASHSISLPTDYESSGSKLSLYDDDSTNSNSKQKRLSAVELMQTDDGSVEAVSYYSASLKGGPSEDTEDRTTDSTSTTSTESSAEESGAGESGESSYEESSHESSHASSSGIYSSEASTQSSSRSVLEQIPEEADGDVDSEWECNKSAVELVKDQQELKDQQAGSLLIRKQLQESESKYEKLMNDYTQLVSKSQESTKTLEEENKKLREREGDALSNMAKDSEEENKARWIKQENKMLLKSLEKQNEVMAKQGKKFEKLEKEHSHTKTELEDKKKRYDQLILDFSNLSGGSKTKEEYTRLKALHQAVVLKLADVVEENEIFEKERDTAIDQSESKDIKIRAYDEAIASLNKTEYDLKRLEEVHEDTVTELQQLGDKNKELKDLYDQEVGNAAGDLEKLQQDYVGAMTELEMLMSSNKEFIGIEEKLNASEVKVAMLEEDTKKMSEKLLATKKKSNARAGQMKEVIAQYKTLKSDYAEKCDKLNRLELTVDDLGSSKAMKEMKAMEKALEMAAEEAAEAVTGKKARESDLKIVLQHYEKLQLKYTALKRKLDSKPFDESLSGCESVTASQLTDEEKKNPKSMDEEKKEDPGSIEENSKYQEEVQNLEKMLKESRESMGWKDDKIAKTLTELKEAKELVEILETEKKDLEVELSEVKSNLLLARKKAENADNRQDNGQDKLRNAIANNHKLQQVYDSLLRKFGDTRGELQKAKNNIKVKEQEEKHARKRAATVHGQYKKLQEDHDVVVQRLEKLKKNMLITQPAEC